MSRQPRKKSVDFLGYIIFFLTIAATVTIALVIYVLIDEKSEGNKTAIAFTMLTVIIALSLICTGIDVIRRRIMIDDPVRKILFATERIAAGDFSVRLHTAHTYEKYDDYDLIMGNLNVMAEALGKSEVLKTDFISNVSHEIKTPLAIIQNYVSLLQKDLEAEKRKNYSKIILQATKRLNDLITNILKLNKLENQKITPEYQKIQLNDMLAECILNFEDVFSEKNIMLDCDLEEVEILSFSGYLEIVWNNLLSNALKFTESGGKISVTLKKDGKNAVVTVADTGCGISPETGARIFDKFYQGDTSHSGEGNGLGLALVKKVIDVLGGEISVKSQIGKGSVFTVLVRGIESEK